MSFSYLWYSTAAISLVGLFFRKQRQQLRFRSFISTLFYVLLTSLLTHEAVSVSVGLPAIRTINNFPDLIFFYISAHILLITWLLFGDLFPSIGVIHPVWPVLFLYSSYFYYQTFFAFEYSNSYPILYLLVLWEALAFLKTNPFQSIFNLKKPNFFVFLSILLFLGWLSISTIFSFSPGDSLNQLLQIICFALLPFLLSRTISNTHSLKLAAAWLMGIGQTLWIITGAYKFMILTLHFGWDAALKNRLMIAGIGPNWIAYSLILLIPLNIAFGIVSKGWKRWFWAIHMVGTVLVLAYSQQNQGVSGWFGLWVGVLVLLVFLYRPQLFRNPRVAVSISLGAVALGGTMVAYGLPYLAQMNGISFFTRLYGWATLVKEVSERPLLGSGLLVRYVSARYGDQTTLDEIGATPNWVVNTVQLTSLRQQQLTYHAHNLFLEIAVGAGVPALILFLWYLWEVFRFGWKVSGWPCNNDARILLAGCVAGLAGVLGWGLIDVMEYSPLFFTFPAWAIIGLILGASRIQEPAS